MALARHQAVAWELRLHLPGTPPQALATPLRAVKTPFSPCGALSLPPWPPVALEGPGC